MGALACLAVFWGLRGEPVHSGTLRVRFSPTGASVALSGPEFPGVSQQTGDAQVDFLNLRGGVAYRLVTNAAGFTQSVQDITMPTKGGLHLVEVRLRPETALYSVTSSPPGAMIFFDGRQIGPSPAVLDAVEPGEHVVEAKMSGYTSARLEFAANTGERKELFLTLEARTQPADSVRAPAQITATGSSHSEPAEASLRLESSHPARFFLNNTLLGYDRMLEQKVPAGRHRVAARVEGRGSQYRMVQLEAQGQQTVRFVFDQDPVERAMEATDPSRPIYWLIRGGNARGEGRYGDAVDSFEAALRLNPSAEEQISLYRQLSRTLPAMGRYPEAISYTQKYLEMAPDAPDAELTRSVLEELERRVGQAAARR